MRNGICHVVVWFLGAFFVGTANGETPFFFDAPKFVGNGCPKNTVSTLFTDDAFTILFDSYTLNIESTGHARAGFRECFITIPVRFAPGYTATVESIDYRGFFQFEKDSEGRFQSWFAFGAGSGGASRQFKGPLELDFFSRDKIRHPGTLTCAKKAPLLLYSSLFALTKKRSRALMTLDSLDGVLTVKLKPRRCR